MRKQNRVIVTREAAKIVKYYGSLRKAAAATGISASMWFSYIHGVYEPKRPDTVEKFLAAVAKVASLKV